MKLSVFNLMGTIVYPDSVGVDEKELANYLSTLLTTSVKSDSVILNMSVKTETVEEVTDSPLLCPICHGELEATTVLKGELTSSLDPVDGAVTGATFEGDKEHRFFCMEDPEHSLDSIQEALTAVSRNF